MPFIYAVAHICPSFVLPDASTKTFGWGTGFFVGDGTDPNCAYLMTAAHVFDPARSNSRYIGFKLDSVYVRQWFKRMDETDAPLVLNESRFTSPQVKYAPSHDVAVMRLATEMAVITGNGKINWLETSILATGADFESGRIWPGQDVLIPGYPGAAANTPPARPFLFSGTIVTDPAQPAHIDNGDQDRTIVCQAFSWGGSSGAPVLCPLAPEPKIIGINTGHFNLGGDSAGVLTTAVRSDVLIELIE
ncbi:S1 family peptidase [Nocardia ninae]|nr:serine protease [Nocardia ninae]